MSESPQKFGSKYWKLSEKKFFNFSIQLSVFDPNIDSIFSKQYD